MTYKRKRHYAVIVGARPNFMKAAPLLNKIKDDKNIKFTLIHTGQHFDDNMSRIFFDELGINVPEINIETGKLKLSNKIGLMASQLEKHLSKNYDGVIVFGDVISTLVGAISAIKNKKPLIHVEAGLRSNDKRMPEETNRIIVDHISDLLFTTEPSGKENLLREGVKNNKIKYVGNLMIESLEIFKDKILSLDSFKKHNLERKKYVVATIHRQENTDSAKS
ncbi:MAG: UDP-N-acetylglucosamine 2-epimerase, partial [Nitrososphaeraceae archaeon]|nr:UDP-N-acetylglucosamine 2-epimerase [Nitrososphaeraceae archaeon]